MTARALLSAVAENRVNFFKLLADLERVSGCHVDDVILTGLIDSEYDGRKNLTAKEAEGLLFACAKKKKQGS